MSEPALLFSPLPEPTPERDPMTGERDADSVLFSLDGAKPPVAAAAPPLGDRESSGLVAVSDLFPDGAPTPDRAPSETRESSGLVNVADIVAAQEQHDADAPSAPVVPIVPVLGPITVTPTPAAAPARRPALPTGFLVAIIVTLLGTLAALAWKISTLP